MLLKVLHWAGSFSFILLNLNNITSFSKARNERFVVKPQNAPIPPTKRVDVTKVPGGTLLCHCGLGAGDNCRFSNSSDKDTVYFFCDGSCECGNMFIPDRSHVQQYETMNGEGNGWMDL